MLHLTVDGLGNFRDNQHRMLTLRGINLDGCAKLPKTPELTTFTPLSEEYWDGDNVSFVGRPFFKLEDAPEHLERIRSWGYNFIRYVYTWEALEHSGPGKYDDEFIDYTIKVLDLLRKYDFYVVLDPHQDLWGRHSGGSGAPMWTYYACGLDPRNFLDTEGALVQNEWPDGGPENFPKMYWATNYAKLVCGTIFTMFFAGEEFFPGAEINGVNIQEYLQTHMLNAMLHFYNRIKRETTLFDDCIMGVETMNEPNTGFIGLKDITHVPQEQQPKLGHIPTVLQAMYLGEGQSAKVDNYTFGNLGPRKAGTEMVDPKGVKVWLEPEYGAKVDSHYGWERSSGWDLGKCIYAQYGVWDPDTRKALKPRFFYTCPKGTGQDVDEPFFVNNYFVKYWQKFYTQMRKNLGSEVYLFCDPPVMALPPKLKGTEYIDDRVVYCPHFYDGLTVMLKKWNRYWTIDGLGVLRGDYLSPVLGLKFGEQNVKNCIRNQITRMRDDGIEYMGENIPCFMTETGIPFDMDDKDPYYKTGDYTSQMRAIDTITYGLEGSRIHHAYWGYTNINTHKEGDGWNGEDFSFWSNDTLLEGEKGSTKQADDINKNSRASEAFIRPYPLAIFGDIIEYGFDLTKGIFKLKIDGEKTASNDEESIASEIYVPEIHFPSEDDFYIDTSSGNVEFDKTRRVLSWYHASGEQTLELTAVQWELGLNFNDNSSCNCNIM